MLRNQILALTALLFVAAPVIAQQPNRDEMRRRSAAIFNRKAPAVGQLAPDVTLLQSDGKPLKLRDLRGHHTVLVFGCLT